MPGKPNNGAASMDCQGVSDLNGAVQFGHLSGFDSAGRHSPSLPKMIREYWALSRRLAMNEIIHFRFIQSPVPATTLATTPQRNKKTVP